MCLPLFPDGKCCRNPKYPNVSGSIDAAIRVLICCCGCKQLIRRRARRRLTGRDSRGAAECWEGVTSPSLSLRSLLFLLHFHPLISHQRLPGRHGAIIVSHLRRHVSLFSLLLPAELNLIPAPPVARPLFCLSMLSSRCRPSTFLLLAGPPPHTFLIS